MVNVGERRTGVITADLSRGFTFARIDGENKDIFCHQRNRRDPNTDLEKGHAVEFTVLRGKDGLYASDIVDLTVTAQQTAASVVQPTAGTVVATSDPIQPQPEPAVVVTIPVAQPTPPTAVAPVPVPPPPAPVQPDQDKVVPQPDPNKIIFEHVTGISYQVKGKPNADLKLVSGFGHELHKQVCWKYSLLPDRTKARKKDNHWHHASVSVITLNEDGVAFFDIKLPKPGLGQKFLLTDGINKSNELFVKDPTPPIRHTQRAGQEKKHAA